MMTRSDEESLDLMSRWGDTLERLIAESRNDLATVVYPYASIWCNHVLPRRDPLDPTRLTDGNAAWVNFAADHYTAIVKVYQAHKKYESIKACCDCAAAGDESADLLMQAHDAIAGFWEFIGCSIDNFARCLEDCPPIALQTREGLEWVRGQYSELAFAYGRRTQSIHYSLVPLGFQSGMIVFNEAQLEQERTDWSEARKRLVITEDFYDGKWTDFLAHMSSAWNALRDWLKRADHCSPAIPNDLSTGQLQGGLNWPASGVSQVVQHRALPDPAMPYWKWSTQPRSSGSA